MRVTITTGTSSRTIEWPLKELPDDALSELRQYAAEHWWDTPAGSKEESFIGAIEMLAVEFQEYKDALSELRRAARALSAKLDASCGPDPAWKAEHDALRKALKEGE